ncbi:glutamate 5-kinase [Telmatospirillum siberiense]|uniref:Glutamate 5-kinase n=1 Tax=Telmatospirillum siberiense TaxID=382514 RepID=A0A2N3PV54_9PROT|nr:glutamate 5-kinase [Telmatospirillum siberiense]PKU24285.1 glutamate 5-kinase [Telmatospirillum siberiense]
MIPLLAAQRLVLKIGSSLLVGEDGEINKIWLNAFCDDIAACRARNQEVIVVTSGAVALGRRHLGLGTGPLRLNEKQAAAATGQIRLAHAYQETLADHGLSVAQLLLTLDDTENRRRYLNARNTLETLLRLGAVPVINENDTVATQEIRFGDNDRLAARVAQMISADTLVLFSDIDGLYTANPRQDPSARFIADVAELTPEIEAMAGDPGSALGSGGMVTKLQAARIALAAGCRMAIAPGKGLHPLKTMAEGGRCTWFHSADEPLRARKQWIAGSVKPQGTLKVDAGAKRALAKGGSLLPAGVVAVDGDFQKGDAVAVVDRDERPVGVGLTAYSADDARRIIGRKSGDFEGVLGYRGPDEIIHRDDLVIEHEQECRSSRR